MKHKILLLLIALFLYQCDKKEEFFFPIENEWNGWKSIEKVVSSEIKDKIIKDLPKEFEYYRLNDKYGPKINDLRNDIHIIDINNDGLDDFIFDGYSGGEPDEISIFINTNKKYLKVFTDYQAVKKLDWENGKLKRIYIHDFGCCGDNGRINKIFEVSYVNNIPKFEQKYQSWYMDVTEFPTNILKKHREFEIIDSNIYLRFSPCVCDSALNSFMEPTGNIFETVPKGTKGRVIGSQLDKSNETWLFVEIYPYENWLSEEKFPTRILGWVNKKFIK